MKQIYTQAQWVLIWLGSDPDGDAHLAFDLAANIAESCCRVLRINISDVARINVRQALDQVGGKISSNIEQDLNMWRAIQKLYLRPWFRRIWVIQEAQSAKPERARVMLGDLQIDFDILAVAACWMDWCNANELQTGPLGGKIANVNSAVIKRGPYLDTISFQTLLHHTRVYESSDPRDKVYAVLGFSASQKVTSRIRPNYTMSAANVYLDVSKALIESGQGIDVLSFVRHGSTVSKDLPSWVCIFEYEGEFVLAWIPYFNAGGSIIHHLPTVSNRVLAIEAFEFGKINTVERALRHAPGPVLTEDDHQILITILRIKAAKKYALQHGLTHVTACYPDKFTDKGQYKENLNAFGQFLRDFSQAYAEKTEGIAYLMLDDNQNAAPDSIFYAVEFEAMKNGGHVDRILQFPFDGGKGVDDPTKAKKIYWEKRKTPSATPRANVVSTSRTTRSPVATTSTTLKLQSKMLTVLRSGMETRRTRLGL
ncbi:MAG: hypothetical protein L6R38_009287 [Xanthoria sp. 2 TBL-2021]|nr:MAG: hypothetical protein L6R38_009287 [Xanthoria sp. 2 TBL-2021]